MTLRLLQRNAARPELYIYGDIGSDWYGEGVTAKGVAEELAKVRDAADLDVRINSYGGDVFQGLAIYRQLVDAKPRVTVHVDGIAASAASVIAMAGDEINVSESGWLMIHDAWTIAIGNAEELRQVADRVDATSAQVAKIYAARGRKSETEVRDWMRDETWFTAAEAVAAGLADNVAANKAIAAKFDPARMKFRHLPKVLSPARQALQDEVSRQAAIVTLSGRRH